MANQNPLTEERFLEVLGEFQKGQDLRFSNLAASITETQKKMDEGFASVRAEAVETKEELKKHIDTVTGSMYESLTETLEQHYVSKEDHQKLEDMVNTLASAN